MCRQKDGLLWLQTWLENFPHWNNYAHPLLSARTHDVHHFGSLIEGFLGSFPADKGFIDDYQQSLWQEEQLTQVVTPNRKDIESSLEQVKLVKKTNYWRKLVETVNSQLSERFQITKIKVKDFLALSKSNL